MAYTPTVWKNGEFPPIDAEHLNKIEQGIANSAPGGFGYGESLLIIGHDNITDDEFVSLLENQLSKLGYNEAMQLCWANHPTVGDSTFVGTLWKSNGGRYAVLTGVTYSGASVVRYKLNDIWKPTEWVNPPMELGVEYRTTERYLGKPVYTKMVNCGNLPNGTTVEVAHGIANIGFIVAAQAIASTNNTVFNGRAYLPGISNESLTDRWTTYLAGVTNQNIRIYCGGGLAGCPVYVTLKYTKTTD